MEDYEARGILGLPYHHKKQDLDRAFQALKDVYYPALHEICGSIDKARLHQIIYTRQTDDRRFFPCDNKSGKISAADRSLYAFIHFADIHDAYHLLAKDKNYRTYNVSTFDVQEYLIQTYGKATADRRQAAAKFNKKTVWLLIPLAIAWIVALAGTNMTIGYVATAIFALLHWGSAIVSMPVYFPTYFLRKLWDGWCTGADFGLLISKLIAIILCGHFCALWALAKMIFYPPAVYDDWKFDLRWSKKFKTFCHKLTDQRIAHTEQLIAEYGKEFNADTLKKARIGFRQIRSWKPSAQRNALDAVSEQVWNNDTNIRLAVAANRESRSSINMGMHSAEQDYSRRSDLIERLSYEETPIGVYRSDSTADSLHEKNEESFKSIYSLYEMEQINNKIEDSLIDQRILLEKCAALVPLMGLSED